MRINNLEHADCPGLILIGGMHGAGKTSLVEAITQEDNYVRIPALSTRAKRSLDDNEYESRTKSELEAMMAGGQLLNLDEVNGEYYAASRTDVDRLHDDGTVGVKEIHPDNFHKFEAYCGATLPVVLVNKPFVTRGGRVISPEDARFTNPFMATALGKVALDVTDFRTIESAAQHVQLAHALERAYRSRYPDPRDIDVDNQNTYSALAPVFVDELRITTRDFHEASVETFDRIVGSMPAGSRVLEIGTGSNWLRQSVDLSHLDVTHQESSQGMYDVHGNGHDRIWSPIRKLPMKSGELDYVVGSLVDGMMYPQALLEMQRVLTEGGRMVLSYPSREWAETSRDGAKKASFQNDGTALHAHSFSPTQEEIEGLLKDVGFTLEEFIACPAAQREKSYYSPALFDREGNVPNSVVNVIVAKKEALRG